MRKVSFILLILVLMMHSLTFFSFATEETTPEAETTQEEKQEDFKESVVNTIGKIVETNGIKEVVTGSVVDQVQEVVVEIIKGDYIGEEFTTEYVLSYDLEGKMLVYELDIGDKVEVQITEDQNGNTTATVMEVYRANNIIWIVVLFFLSIIIIGGKNGIRTVLGLIFTIAFIYLFMVRRVFYGANAISNSIFTAIVVIIGTFIIISGLNRKTVSAAIGTFGGVISAGIIGLIFNHLSKLTGAYEDAISLSTNLSIVQFSFRDLLFASLLISSLGACMNIGISIATALDEVKKTEPDVTWQELFKKGMEVGKNNIGTMTNTLVLAYLGASLSLLMLYMVSDTNLLGIINKEKIAEQIVLAIIGSMGVVYTVPITSIIYALINRHKIIYKRVAENKVDGKRSLKL